MAEIPVERKSGFPWWLPVLALLGLLLLGFLFMRGCDDRGGAAVVNANGNLNRNADTRPAVASAPAAAAVNAGSAAAERVTDVNLFGTAADKASLVGRRAELQNVRVSRVLSDHVFTVTSGGGEMFVLLDESLDTGGGKEQQIRARPGQVVNLGGEFRRVPSGEASGERGQGLNAGEYRQMADQQVYLHATQASDAR